MAERINMKIYSKKRTIGNMILAPALNFLIGQLVVIVATVLVTVQLSMSGIPQEELTAQVSNQIFQYNVPITAISSLLMLPLAYFFLYERQQRQIYRAFQVCRMLLIIPFGMALCLGVNMLITISGLPELFPGYGQFAESIYQGNLLFEILAVGVLPAMVEELIYRGILYKGFRKFVPVVAANLLSAFVFGVMHMNMVQFVYAFVLGMAFAWVYERYKTLWAPVLMHMSANVFSVLLTEWEPLANFINSPTGSIVTLVGMVVGITIVPVALYKVTKKSL